MDICGENLNTEIMLEFPSLKRENMLQIKDQKEYHQFI